MEEFRSPITGQRVTQRKRDAAWWMRQLPTPAEERLWQALRAKRLDGLHFRRSQIVDGFIADFYCHAVRLVVEVDGSIHAEQRDWDVERDRIFAARGIHVLRVTNDEVLITLRSVLTRIRQAAMTTTPSDTKEPMLQAPPPFREGAGG